MRIIDLDKWAEIFDTIRRHPLRTLLTALSVWWAIFMLIILVGAGSGLENSVEHNFADDAINSLWIYPGMTSVEHEGLPPGRRVRFSNIDYESLRDNVDGVEVITGRNSLRSEFLINRGNESLSYRVRCVHPGYKIIENTLVFKGRYINEQDIEEYRKVCVIGVNVRDAFYEDGEEALGTYLKINDIEYKVVGIFDDTGSDREKEMLYIPLSTAQKVYFSDGQIHQIMMTLGDATVEESQKIEAHVRHQLATIHKFSPDDEQALYIGNGLEEYREFKMVMGFIKGFIWFVGIGSIIAGIIGVSNIMLIVVKDRTKEIGIRKAIGATPWSIISMIMQEAIFITAVAGYLGLLMGFGVIYGINSLLVANDADIEFFRDPEVRFPVVMLALAMLVISGALSGLLPALQAVKVNPVTAMKSQ